MKTSILLVTLFAACATAPQAPVAAPCPATVAPPAAAAPALDEATVKQMSHALFDAYDRADAGTLRDLTGPTFGLYEEQRFLDHTAMLDMLKQRADRHAPIHSRTWGDERVLLSAGTAIFFGDATEHVPAEGDRQGSDDEGANTLVWVRDGDRWHAVIWQWTPAGIEAERARWNRWLVEGHGFNHKPNQLLVDTVKGRKPGTALDLATGQGRNAVFLATQGWKVTGIDISDEGLRLAREEAAREKVKLETVQADMDKYDYGTDKWDLVTMIYAGNDTKLLERIKPAVKKGGLFVTEYFASDSELAKGGGGGWDPKDLEAAFKSGWTILRDDHVEAPADWASQRTTKLVRFVAQKTGEVEATWQEVGGVMWGVAFNGNGYEVDYIDGSPRTRTSLVDGDHPQTVAQTRSMPAISKARRVPALEAADRAFAADTAKDGADGWVRHFDEHGAMWRKDHRVEGADIKASIAKTLAAGKLTWQPVTSGARGDLGFTVGTATFEKDKLTYCTIWKRQKDGSWKVLFDIGQPAQ
jgi:SAM-dependent methyltransferase